jgi:hypothetical protein
MHILRALNILGDLSSISLHPLFYDKKSWKSHLGTTAAVIFALLPNHILRSSAIKKTYRKHKIPNIFKKAMQSRIPQLLYTLPL